MRYVYVIFFLLLLALGWAFGFQNADVLRYPVSFGIQLWLLTLESFPIPLGGMLILVFFLGGLGASIFLFGRELRLRRDSLRHKSQIRGLEREIKTLREQILMEAQNYRPSQPSSAPAIADASDEDTDHELEIRRNQGV